MRVHSRNSRKPLFPVVCLGVPLWWLWLGRNGWGHTSRKCERIGLATFLLAGWMSAVHAEDPLPDVGRLKTSPVLQHLKPNPMPVPPRSPPEETLTRMYLPEGFRAELVAGEPDRSEEHTSELQSRFGT